MIAIITHPEAAPNQIGDPLRGPDRRRESLSLGSLREQARKLRESSAGQFRRAAAPAGPRRLGGYSDATAPSLRAFLRAKVQLESAVLTDAFTSYSGLTPRSNYNAASRWETTAN